MKYDFVAMTSVADDLHNLAWPLQIKDVKTSDSKDWLESEYEVTTQFAPAPRGRSENK